MSRSNLHDVQVIFEHSTEKAVLVKKDEDQKDGVWLPKSLCEYEPSDPERGQVITLTAKEGLLTEKGLV